MKNIRLKKWAELNGYTYRGAWNAYSNGKIPGAYILPSGSIVVPCEELEKQKPEKIVVYSRVSSPKQKPDLDSQAKRIADFCAANGWVVSAVFKEVASGLNDDRRLLNSILSDVHVTKIVVEHKDRLTRFGFNYIEKLLKMRGCEVVVINRQEVEADDLMTDFVSIITSMVARLYGLRRSKRQTELLIRELSAK